MKKPPRWPGAIVVITLMAAFCAVAAAQNLYRWVDSNGNVQYSDQPPPGDAKDAKQLNRNQPALDDNAQTSSDSDSYIEQEAEFRERQKSQNEQEKNARLEAEKVATIKKNCEIARNNLRTLTDPTGGRARQVNSEGVLVWLSQEQVDKEKEQARKDIEKWCKG